ncbi:MAG: histidine kinase [Clostridiales bacterium]|jgi:two-component system sensor histidine kinase YesM|nr:histidine kinase [Clostridiales bacterium]
MGKRRFSLRSRLKIFSAVAIALFFLLLAYNNYWALSYIQRQTRATAESMVKTQVASAGDRLAEIEKYLAGFVFDSGDIILLERSGRDKTIWFSALRNVQKSFNAALPAHIADGFFLYSPEQNIFAHGVALVPRALNSAIKEAVGSGLFFTSENAGKWIAIATSEGNYIARAISVRESYVGAWISVDSLLRLLFGNSDSLARFDLIGADGQLLGKVSDELEAGSYSLVSVPLDGESVSLAALISEDVLKRSSLEYWRVMLFVFIAFSALILTGVFVMKPLVITPIGVLSQALKRLRDGDVNVQVDGAGACLELDEVNLTFNEMAKEIKTLRIGVYEEKLKRQKLRIEYMKSQMSPHFLINCLNTVHSLSETGRDDLVRKMTSGLSRHLRYAMSSCDTVALSWEAEHAANFVSLQSIRYLGTLSLETDFAPETLDCKVVPLMILNFLENTAKHEASVESPVVMHASSCSVSRDGKPWVHICIWDTGRGYSPETLRGLQNQDKYLAEAKGKIGISNVLQRAKTLLGDCEFRFSNREGAGAQVDILVPDEKAGRALVESHDIG